MLSCPTRVSVARRMRLLPASHICQELGLGTKEKVRLTSCARARPADADRSAGGASEVAEGGGAGFEEEETDDGPAVEGPFAE
jgi:hypothetical protein